MRLIGPHRLCALPVIGSLISGSLISGALVGFFPISCVLAAGALITTASAPAGAQEWREYAYPDEGFTGAFPAEPKVETTSYPASGGRLVEARVYSVVRESGAFKVTVADFSHTEMSDGNVMAYAVLMLARDGEINFDIPHSTRRIVGRQAGIDRADGSRTYASVFFHNRRLFQIEGTVPAGGAAADAVRFQQSFDFTDGWRLPDALSNEIRTR